MHEPKELSDLFDEQNEDFDFPNYLSNFAPYWYTYVAGYRTSVQQLLVAAQAFPSKTSALKYVAGQTELAVGRVPRPWKECFESKDWNECTHLQITKAFNGEPLRLDKACLAIKSLHLAFIGALYPQPTPPEFFAQMRLRPAIYVVRGMEGDERMVLQPKRGKAGSGEHNALVDRICQTSAEKRGPALTSKARSFLSLLADGYPVTYSNARLVKDFYHAEMGCRHVIVAALEDRTNGGSIKKKECNISEAPFVSFEAAGGAAKETSVQ